MGSDLFLVLLIGVTGALIGVVTMAIISRNRTARRPYRSKRTEQEGMIPEKAESVLVLNEAVDIRELRILRALFDEPNGRFLASFKDAYYRSSLEATIDKCWVKTTGRRYYMTPKGEEFCRTYLEQLLHEHEPAPKV